MSENLVQLSRRFADLRGGLEAIKRQMLKALCNGAAPNFFPAPRPGLKGALKNACTRSPAKSKRRSSK